MRKYLTSTRYKQLCKDLGETPESLHEFAKSLSPVAKDWKSDYFVLINLYTYV